MAGREVAQQRDPSRSRGRPRNESSTTDRRRPSETIDITDESDESDENHEENHEENQRADEEQDEIFDAVETERILSSIGQSMPEDEADQESSEEDEVEDDIRQEAEDDIRQEAEEDELEEPNDRNGWQVVDPFPYSDIAIVLDGDTQFMKRKLFEKARHLDSSIRRTVFEQTQGKLCI